MMNLCQKSIGVRVSLRHGVKKNNQQHDTNATQLNSKDTNVIIEVFEWPKN